MSLNVLVKSSLNGFTGYRELHLLLLHDLSNVFTLNRKQSLRYSSVLIYVLKSLLKVFYFLTSTSQLYCHN